LNAMHIKFSMLKVVSQQMAGNPFMGSSTTGVVAKRMKRAFIGFEVAREYFEIADRRIKAEKQLGFAQSLATQGV